MTTTAYAELDSSTCSIARTMAVLGKPWTVVVLRDLFNGVRRFDELVEHLGIARTVLRDRLTALVDAGWVSTVDYQEFGARKRKQYLITTTGLELRPVLLALLEFGDRHLAGAGGAPMLITHRGCGGAVHVRTVCEHGHELSAADKLLLTPGPGSRVKT
jgi:DNA-binding HxlR family transcriptional regulator